MALDILGSLPEGSSLGIISFANTTQIWQPLPPAADWSPQGYLNVPYAGYTNTGEAMTAAVKMLDQSQKKIRSIILLTDGEVMLPEPTQTLQSVNALDEALEQAENKEIDVYIIRLPYKDGHTDYSLHSAYTVLVDTTDENIFSGSAEVLSYLDTNITEVPLDGITSGEKVISIPEGHEGSVKLKLVSDKPGQAEAENEGAAVMSGKYVSLFDVPEPTDGNVKLKLNYPSDANLKLSMVNVDKTEPAADDDKISYNLRRALAIGGFLLLAGIVWIYFLFGKKKPARALTESEIPYTGKLGIYVMHTADGTEIPPLECNLFRQVKNRRVTLQEIIDSFDLKQKFKGAERIYFEPIKNGISVINDSRCTITKNKRILLQGSEEKVYSEERLYVAFEDEVSEILLIYKSLKPSELNKE